MIRGLTVRQPHAQLILLGEKTIELRSWSTRYRGDLLICAALAEVERLRAEVERLSQILGRIVEGDGDSTLTIRADKAAFAAAKEYLMRQRAGD